MVKDMALESKCAAVRRGKESPVNVGRSALCDRMQVGG
jgi:hypothetical protein